MRLVSLSLSAAILLAGCATSKLDGVELNSSNIQNAAAVSLAYRLIGPNGPDTITWGLAYLIYDPMAPNWEIEETRLSEDTFFMQLRMKRYHTGGGGESMQVLKRRAGQLQRELGFGGYRILDYSEGIDSQSIGARRFGEGTIRLVRR